MILTKDTRPKGPKNLYYQVLFHRAFSKIVRLQFPLKKSQDLFFESKQLKIARKSGQI